VQPVERLLAPQGLLTLQLDASAGARLRWVEWQARQGVPWKAMRAAGL